MRLYVFHTNENINNKNAFFFSVVNVSGLTNVAGAGDTKLICGCYRREWNICCAKGGGYI